MTLWATVVVQLKIFFQEICKKKYEWDEELQDEMRLKWLHILDNIQKVEEIQIPRCYNYYEVNDPFDVIQLIGFSDASPVAYGSCVYIKFVTRSGKIHVSFVTSKSRIAPLKREISIPRLELLGNVLLSRLMTSVLAAFDPELEISNIMCFTDSKVSLAWIQNDKREMKQFVQNRVNEIRNNVDTNKWQYCKTSDNPADLITRINFNGIRNDLWWHGPDFIKNIHDESTVREYSEVYTRDNLQWDIGNNDDFKTELKEPCMVLISNTSTENTVSSVIDIEKYNDVMQLFKVTALVVRFIQNLKKKVKKETMFTRSYITADELKRSRLLWIKANQINLCGEKEYGQLEVQLNLRSDADDVIRSYGRMKNACLADDTKAPVILSRNHRLAKLLVLYCHVKVYHRGVRQTLTEFRASYWITRGRSFVKKVIRPCIVCQKLNVRPLKYPAHSELPTVRFDERYPFASSGLDHMGPLYCSPVYVQTEKSFKAYVLLYTCLSTRAIILDVVHSTNAKTVVQSLRRFISRRGCPAIIVSDNGSSFTAEETQKFAASKFIEWRVNLALAPWQGGIWERLVSCVKRCIKKAVGVRSISYIEVQTLLSEIEAVLNNRPLCHDYDDDLENVLTPNHLVYGRRLESSIENDKGVIELEDSIQLTKREKHLNRLISVFWNVWRKEYLTMIRETHKLSRTRGDEKLAVDDIVIVYEKHQPRHLWKLGRIVDLIRGNDNVVRGAKVKFGASGNIITRPLNLLYPLEVREKPMQIHETTSNTTDNPRPKRKCRIIGEMKRRNEK